MIESDELRRIGLVVGREDTGQFIVDLDVVKPRHMRPMPLIWSIMVQQVGIVECNTLHGSTRLELLVDGLHQPST